MEFENNQITNIRILFLNQWMHPKNLHALYKYQDVVLNAQTRGQDTKRVRIEIVTVRSLRELEQCDLSQFNGVYSPCVPLDANRWPNTRFMFGPHFSVFPEAHQMQPICGLNSIYTQPSLWAKMAWKYHDVFRKGNNVPRLEILPFGVDTDLFNETKPAGERERVFIYYKKRNPSELEKVKSMLEQKGYSYRLYNYDVKYTENDYINTLHESKFGIWIGEHESQGFALQEALSCNVPLFVWSVSSMNQEYGSRYDDIAATTIPYWNELCGEVMYHGNELEPVFDVFISKLEENQYNPRKYVLDNLSIQVCAQRFFQLFETI